MPSTATDVLRNSDLNSLVALLRDHRARAYDVVVAADQIGMNNGRMVLKGTEPVLTDDGVAQIDGVYDLTDVAIEGFSSRLDISGRDLRRAYRLEHPDGTPRRRLFDMTVKGWLWEQRTDQHLMRILRTSTPTDGGSHGKVRAVLSNRYQIIDSLDVVLATLRGLNDAGIKDPQFSCDLTERRLHLKVRVPEVSAAAPSLLAGYRSPFTGALGADNPLVDAGIFVRNSETGNGMFEVGPYVTIQVCNNGMQVAHEDKRSKRHTGARLEQCAIRWSEKTQQINAQLITSQVSDAVREFVSPDYLRGVIAGIERQAGAPVTDAPKTIEVVSKQLGFTKDEAAGILDMFIRGGDVTAGGVMQAMTAYAQTVGDGDAAAALEAKALPALTLAATAR